MEDIQELAQNIKTRFDHEASKRALKEKYEAKMLFAEFGGMWKASPELLTLLSTIDSGINDEAVLADEYGNPCKVHVLTLREAVKARWQEQMNAWFQEYEEQQKNR